MEDTVVLINSDSEEYEPKIFKEKEKLIKQLWDKGNAIVFHHLSSESNLAFPYVKFKNFYVELKTILSKVTLESSKSFIWQNLIQWLIAMKLSYSGSVDLKFDEKFNFILIDFMAEYINYKCKLNLNLNNDHEIQKQINGILDILGIMFNGNSSYIVMTLVKIDVLEEYANILKPLYNKILSDKHAHKSKEFISYLELILCFKQYKKLARSKEEREAINEIAVGKSMKTLGKNFNEKCTNIQEGILPRSVPQIDDNNRTFITISDLIGHAIKKRNFGTRNLLIKKSLDLDEAIEKYFIQYERKINRFDTSTLYSSNVEVVNDNVDKMIMSIKLNDNENVAKTDKFVNIQKTFEFDVNKLSSQQRQQQMFNQQPQKQQHLSNVCDININKKNRLLDNKLLNSNTISNKKNNSDSSLVSRKNNQNCDHNIVENIIEIVDDSSEESDNNSKNLTGNTTKNLKKSVPYKKSQLNNNVTGNLIKNKNINKNNNSLDKVQTILLLSSSDEDDNNISRCSSRNSSVLSESDSSISETLTDNFKPNLRNSPQLKEKFNSISPLPRISPLPSIQQQSINNNSNGENSGTINIKKLDKQRCIPGEVSSTTSLDFTISDQSGIAAIPSTSSAVEVHSASANYETLRNIREVGNIIKVNSPSILSSPFKHRFGVANNSIVSNKSISYSDISSDDEDDHEFSIARNLYSRIPKKYIREIEKAISSTSEIDGVKGTNSRNNIGNSTTESSQNLNSENSFFINQRSVVSKQNTQPERIQFSFTNNTKNNKEQLLSNTYIHNSSQNKNNELNKNSVSCLAVVPYSPVTSSNFKKSNKYFVNLVDVPAKQIPKVLTENPNIVMKNNSDKESLNIKLDNYKTDDNNGVVLTENNKIQKQSSICRQNNELTFNITENKIVQKAGEHIETDTAISDVNLEMNKQFSTNTFVVQEISPENTIEHSLISTRNDDLDCKTSLQISETVHVNSENIIKNTKALLKKNNSSDVQEADPNSNWTIKEINIDKILPSLVTPSAVPTSFPICESSDISMQVTEKSLHKLPILETQNLQSQSTSLELKRAHSLICNEVLFEKCLETAINVPSTTNSTKLIEKSKPTQCEPQTTIVTKERNDILPKYELNKAAVIEEKNNVATESELKTAPVLKNNTLPQITETSTKQQINQKHDNVKMKVSKEKPDPLKESIQEKCVPLMKAPVQLTNMESNDIKTENPLKTYSKKSTFIKRIHKVFDDKTFFKKYSKHSTTIKIVKQERKNSYTTKGQDIKKPLKTYTKQKLNKMPEKAKEQTMNKSTELKLLSEQVSIDLHTENLPATSSKKINCELNFDIKDLSGMIINSPQNYENERNSEFEYANENIDKFENKLKSENKIKIIGLINKNINNKDMVNQTTQQNNLEKMVPNIECYVTNNIANPITLSQNISLPQTIAIDKKCDTNIKITLTDKENENQQNSTETLSQDLSLPLTELFEIEKISNEKESKNLTQEVSENVIEKESENVSENQCENNDNLPETLSPNLSLPNPELIEIQTISDKNIEITLTEKQNANHENSIETSFKDLAVPLTELIEIEKKSNKNHEISVCEGKNDKKLSGTLFPDSSLSFTALNTTCKKNIEIKPTNKNNEIQTSNKNVEISVSEKELESYETSIETLSQDLLLPYTKPIEIEKTCKKNIEISPTENENHEKLTGSLSQHFSLALAELSGIEKICYHEKSSEMLSSDLLLPFTELIEIEKTHINVEHPASQKETVNYGKSSETLSQGLSSTEFLVIEKIPNKNIKISLAENESNNYNNPITSVSQNVLPLTELIQIEKTHNKNINIPKIEKNKHSNKKVNISIKNSPEMERENPFSYFTENSEEKSIPNENLTVPKNVNISTTGQNIIININNKINREKIIESSSFNCKQIFFKEREEREIITTPPNLIETVIDFPEKEKEPNKTEKNIEKETKSCHQKINLEVGALMRSVTENVSSIKESEVKPYLANHKLESKKVIFAAENQTDNLEDINIVKKAEKNLPTFVESGKSDINKLSENTNHNAERTENHKEYVNKNNIVNISTIRDIDNNINLDKTLLKVQTETDSLIRLNDNFDNAISTETRYTSEKLIQIGENELEGQKTNDNEDIILSHKIGDQNEYIKNSGSSAYLESTGILEYITKNSVSSAYLESTGILDSPIDQVISKDIHNFSDNKKHIKSNNQKVELELYNENLSIEKKEILSKIVDVLDNTNSLLDKQHFSITKDQIRSNDTIIKMESANKSLLIENSKIPKEVVDKFNKTLKHPTSESATVIRTVETKLSNPIKEIVAGGLNSNYSDDIISPEKECQDLVDNNSKSIEKPETEVEINLGDISVKTSSLKELLPTNQVQNLETELNRDHLVKNPNIQQPKIILEMFDEILDVPLTPDKKLQQEISNYQNTPFKLRIKRRLSQCANINEMFDSAFLQNNQIETTNASAEILTKSNELNKSSNENEMMTSLLDRIDEILDEKKEECEIKTKKEIIPKIDVLESSIKQNTNDKIILNNKYSLNGKNFEKTSTKGVTKKNIIETFEDNTIVKKELWMKIIGLGKTSSTIFTEDHTVSWEDTAEANNCGRRRKSRCIKRLSIDEIENNVETLTKENSENDNLENDPFQGVIIPMENFPIQNENNDKLIRNKFELLLEAAKICDKQIINQNNTCSKVPNKKVGRPPKKNKLTDKIPARNTRLSCSILEKEEIETNVRKALIINKPTKSVIRNPNQPTNNNQPKKFVRFLTPDSDKILLPEKSLELIDSVDYTEVFNSVNKSKKRRKKFTKHNLHIDAIKTNKQSSEEQFSNIKDDDNVLTNIQTLNSRPISPASNSTDSDDFGKLVIDIPEKIIPKTLSPLIKEPKKKKKNQSLSNYFKKTETQPFKTQSVNEEKFILTPPVINLNPVKLMEEITTEETNDKQLSFNNHLLTNNISSNLKLLKSSNQKYSSNRKNILSPGVLRLTSEVDIISINGTNLSEDSESLDRSSRNMSVTTVSPSKNNTYCYSSPDECQIMYPIVQLCETDDILNIEDLKYPTKSDKNSKKHNRIQLRKNNNTINKKTTKQNLTALERCTTTSQNNKSDGIESKFRNKLRKIEEIPNDSNILKDNCQLGENLLIPTKAVNKLVNPRKKAFTRKISRRAEKRKERKLATDYQKYLYEEQSKKETNLNKTEVQGLPYDITPKFRVLHYPQYIEKLTNLKYGSAKPQQASLNVIHSEPHKFQGKEVIKSKIRVEDIKNEVIENTGKMGEYTASLNEDTKFINDFGDVKNKKIIQAKENSLEKNILKNNGKLTNKNKIPLLTKNESKLQPLIRESKLTQTLLKLKTSENISNKSEENFIFSPEETVLERKLPNNTKEIIKESSISQKVVIEQSEQIENIIPIQILQIHKLDTNMTQKDLSKNEVNYIWNNNDKNIELNDIRNYKADDLQKAIKSTITDNKIVTDLDENIDVEKITEMNEVDINIEETNAKTISDCQETSVSIPQVKFISKQNQKPQTKLGKDINSISNKLLEIASHEEANWKSNSDNKLPPKLIIISNLPIEKERTVKINELKLEMNKKPTSIGKPLTPLEETKKVNLIENSNSISNLDKQIDPKVITNNNVNITNESTVLINEPKLELHKMKTLIENPLAIADDTKKVNSNEKTYSISNFGKEIAPKVIETRNLNSENDGTVLRNESKLELNAKKISIEKPLVIADKTMEKTNSKSEVDLKMVPKVVTTNDVNRENKGTVLINEPKLVLINEPKLELNKTETSIEKSLAIAYETKKNNSIGKTNSKSNLKKKIVPKVITTKNVNRENEGKVLINELNETDIFMANALRIADENKIVNSNEKTISKSNLDKKIAPKVIATKNECRQTEGTVLITEPKLQVNEKEISIENPLAIADETKKLNSVEKSNSKPNLDKKITPKVITNHINRENESTVVINAPNLQLKKKDISIEKSLAIPEVNRKNNCTSTENVNKESEKKVLINGPKLEINKKETLIENSSANPEEAIKVNSIVKTNSKSCLDKKIPPKVIPIDNVNRKIKSTATNNVNKENESTGLINEAKLELNKKETFIEKHLAIVDGTKKVNSNEKFNSELNLDKQIAPKIITDNVNSKTESTVSINEPKIDMNKKEATIEKLLASAEEIIKVNSIEKLNSESNIDKKHTSKVVTSDNVNRESDNTIPIKEQELEMKKEETIVGKLLAIAEETNKVKSIEKNTTKSNWDKKNAPKVIITQSINRTNETTRSINEPKSETNKKETSIDKSIQEKTKNVNKSVGKMFTKTHEVVILKQVIKPIQYNIKVQPIALFKVQNILEDNLKENLDSESILGQIEDISSYLPQNEINLKLNKIKRLNNKKPDLIQNSELLNQDIKTTEKIKKSTTVGEKFSKLEQEKRKTVKLLDDTIVSTEKNRTELMPIGQLNLVSMETIEKQIGTLETNEKQIVESKYSHIDMLKNPNRKLEVNDISASVQNICEIDKDSIYQTDIYKDLTSTNLAKTIKKKCSVAIENMALRTLKQCKIKQDKPFEKGSRRKLKELCSDKKKLLLVQELDYKWNYNLLSEKPIKLKSCFVDLSQFLHDPVIEKKKMELNKTKNTRTITNKLKQESFGTAIRKCYNKSLTKVSDNNNKKIIQPADVQNKNLHLNNFTNKICKAKALTSLISPELSEKINLSVSSSQICEVNALTDTICQEQTVNSNLSGSICKVNAVTNPISHVHLVKSNLSEITENTINLNPTINSNETDIEKFNFNEIVQSTVENKELENQKYPISNLNSINAKDNLKILSKYLIEPINDEKTTVISDNAEQVHTISEILETKLPTEVSNFNQNNQSYKFNINSEIEKNSIDCNIANHIETGKALQKLISKIKEITDLDDTLINKDLPSNTETEITPISESSITVQNEEDEINKLKINERTSNEHEQISTEKLSIEKQPEIFKTGNNSFIKNSIKSNEPALTTPSNLNVKITNYISSFPFCEMPPENIFEGGSDNSNSSEYNKIDPIIDPLSYQWNTTLDDSNSLENKLNSKHNMKRKRKIRRSSSNKKSRLQNITTEELRTIAETKKCFIKLTRYETVEDLHEQIKENQLESNIENETDTSNNKLNNSPNSSSISINSSPAKSYESDSDTSSTISNTEDIQSTILNVKMQLDNLKDLRFSANDNITDHSLTDISPNSDVVNTSFKNSVDDISFGSSFDFSTPDWCSDTILDSITKDLTGHHEYSTNNKGDYMISGKVPENSLSLRDIIYPLIDTDITNFESDEPLETDEIDVDNINKISSTLNKAVNMNEILDQSVLTKQQQHQLLENNLTNQINPDDFLIPTDNYISTDVGFDFQAHDNTLYDFNLLIENNSKILSNDTKNSIVHKNNTLTMKNDLLSNNKFNNNNIIHSTPKKCNDSQNTKVNNTPNVLSDNLLLDENVIQQYVTTENKTDPTKKFFKEFFIPEKDLAEASSSKSNSDSFISIDSETKLIENPNLSDNSINEEKLNITNKTESKTVRDVQVDKLRADFKINSTNISIKSVDKSVPNRRKSLIELSISNKSTNNQKSPEKYQTIKTSESKLMSYPTPYWKVKNINKDKQQSPSIKLGKSLEQTSISAIVTTSTISVPTTVTTTIISVSTTETASIISIPATVTTSTMSISSNTTASSNSILVDTPSMSTRATIELKNVIDKTIENNANITPNCTKVNIMTISPSPIPITASSTITTVTKSAPFHMPVLESHDYYKKMKPIINSPNVTILPKNLPQFNAGITLSTPTVVKPEVVIDFIPVVKKDIQSISTSNLKRPSTEINSSDIPTKRKITENLESSGVGDIFDQLKNQPPINNVQLKLDQCKNEKNIVQLNSSSVQSIINTTSNAISNQNITTKNITNCTQKSIINNCTHSPTSKTPINSPLDRSPKISPGLGKQPKYEIDKTKFTNSTGFNKYSYRNPNIAQNFTPSPTNRTTENSPKITSTENQNKQGVILNNKNHINSIKNAIAKQNFTPSPTTLIKIPTTLIKTPTKSSPINQTNKIIPSTNHKSVTNFVISSNQQQKEPILSTIADINAKIENFGQPKTYGQHKQLQELFKLKQLEEENIKRKAELDAKILAGKQQQKRLENKIHQQQYKKYSQSFNTTTNSLTKTKSSKREYVNLFSKLNENPTSNKYLGKFSFNGHNINTESNKVQPLTIPTEWEYQQVSSDELLAALRKQKK